MIRAATMTNMPPQARFDEALYAVSRERQLTPRLIQARLVSYLQTLSGGLAFGAGIFHQALPFPAAPFGDGLPRRAGQSAQRRGEGEKTTSAHKKQKIDPNPRFA